MGLQARPKKMKPTTEHGNIELTEAQAKIVGVQRQPGGSRSLKLVRRIWVAYPLGFGLSKGAGLESTSSPPSAREKDAPTPLTVNTPKSCKGQNLKLGFRRNRDAIKASTWTGFSPSYELAARFIPLELGSIGLSKNC